MTTKKVLGIAGPPLAAVIVIAVVFVFTTNPAIRYGVVLGLTIAIVQTAISVIAMKATMNKNTFYWIWGGGVLFRLFVFCLTALMVYSYTSINLVATLLSLVTATMLFLVLESTLFIKR